VAGLHGWTEGVGVVFEYFDGAVDWPCKNENGLWHVLSCVVMANWCGLDSMKL